MPQIYLAIDYRSEGWALTRCDTAEEALQIVKDGGSHGSPWKILKELAIHIDVPTE